MSASYDDRCMPRNRFRFNRETRRCEDFAFMGCGRNAGSYRTLEECEARCGEMGVASTLPARVREPVQYKKIWFNYVDV